MSDARYGTLSAEREAAERVSALLSLPVPDYQEMVGSEGTFDPWLLFPIYGNYSSEFDECAIDVLGEVLFGEKVRRDLGAEMFREMLCNINLCDYGTSPRVCFPTPQFRRLLPEFLEKWKAYSDLAWGRSATTEAQQKEKP